MAHLISLRFVFCLVLIGAGGIFAGSGIASADSHPKEVQIYSGFETAAVTSRTRTIIRIRREAGRLVINRTTLSLGSDDELSGGPNGNASGTAARAATGRSRETVEKGVRLINKR